MENSLPIRVAVTPNRPTRADDDLLIRAAQAGERAEVEIEPHLDGAAAQLLRQQRQLQAVGQGHDLAALGRTR